MKARLHAMNPCQVGQDVRPAGYVRRHGIPRDEPDVVQHHHVARVAHRHRDVTIVPTDGKHQVSPGEVLRQRSGDVDINPTVLQVGDRNLEMEAQGEGQPVLVECSLVDKHRAELGRRGLLRVKRAGKLRLSDETFGHQQLAELHR